MEYLFGKAPPTAALAAQQNRAAEEVHLVPLGGFDARGLPILEPDSHPPTRALELIDLPLLTADPPVKTQDEEIRHQIIWSSGDPDFTHQDELPRLQTPRQTVRGIGFDSEEERECQDFPMCGLSADPLPGIEASPQDGLEFSAESPDLSQIMLPCLDEDDLPDFMPYAEDNKATGPSFFEFWVGLFRQPTPVTSGATEEAEPIIPAIKPECREDPNHPYQDAGCPFMGPCPAGRRRSPEPIPVMPKMEAEPQLDVEVLGLWHRRLPCMVESSNAEESPVHPEVDTMEFRPSDAKMKAFENWLKRQPF
jgi:hypothetical protein